MSYFIICLSLLFAFQTSDPEPKGLSISATGKVELPADQVIFNINVNALEDTPQAAYDTHQAREEALVELLDKFDIKEEDISYEPISISKVRNYNRESEEEPSYQTQQTVNVILRDFDVYEKIQVGLIQNSFDNFNGNFTSSNSDEGKDEALKKAIQEAKRKAQIIADEAGVDIGSILDISYSVNNAQPYVRETAQLKTQSDSGSLLKYNQTVTVTASVSIRYALLQ